MLEVNDFMENINGLSNLETKVESSIKSLFSDKPEFLYRMMEYQFGWADENGQPVFGFSTRRAHSLFCMFICDLLSGNPDRATPAANAVELVQEFSQVHNDIQSANPENRRRSTVWWIWGHAQGINVGDGLYALARLELSRLREVGLNDSKVLEAFQLLDEACLDLFQSQFEEILLEEKMNISKSDYLRIAESKTGSLFGVAGQLGALTANSDPETILACYKAGRKLGLAFQLLDEIKSLWGDAQRSEPDPRLLNKKRIFPVIFTLDHAEPKIKRELGGLYFKRVLEPSDLQRVVEILNSVDSFNNCWKVMDTAFQEACDVLRPYSQVNENTYNVNKVLADIIGLKR